MAVHLLFVCTANVCRSAMAQALTQQVLATAGLTGVQVASAGTAAVPDLPGCAMVPGAAELLRDHRSRPLDTQGLQWADLVLVAARDNQAAAIERAPAVRGRMFTIRQAGRLSKWLLDTGMIAAARQRAETPDDWAQHFLPDDPRRDVAPMPPPEERARWFATELDAARGLAPLPAEANPDDLLDSHTSTLSADNHQTNFQQIWYDVSWLVAALAEVLRD